MDSFAATPSPSTSQTQSSNSDSHQATSMPTSSAGNSTFHFVASNQSPQSSSFQDTQSWLLSSSDATFLTPPLQFTPEESAQYAELFGFGDSNANQNLGNANASSSAFAPPYDTDMELEPQNGFNSSWVNSHQAAQINNSIGDPVYDSCFNPAPNVPNADDVSPSLDHLFNYPSSYQPSASTSNIQIAYPVSNMRGDFSNEDDNRPWSVPIQDRYPQPSSEWNSSTATGYSTSTNAFESGLVAAMSNMSMSSMSPFGRPLRQTPNYSPLNPSSNTTFQTTRQFVYTPDAPGSLATAPQLPQPQSERSKGKQKEAQSERSKGKQRESDPVAIERTPFQRWAEEQGRHPPEDPDEEWKSLNSVTFIAETGHDSGSDFSSDDDDSDFDGEPGEIRSPASPRNIAPLPRERARRVATVSSAGPSSTSSIPVNSTFGLGRSAADAMTVDDTSFPSASPIPSTVQSNGSVPMTTASGATPVASTSRQDPAIQSSATLPPPVPSSYTSSSSNNTGSLPTTTTSTSTHHPASFVRIVEVADDDDVKTQAEMQSRSLPVHMESLILDNPAFVPPTANPTPIANSTGPTPNPQPPSTNASSLAPILGPSSSGVHASPAPIVLGVGPSSVEASSSHPSTSHPELSPDVASFSTLTTSAPLLGTPSPCMSASSPESPVSPQTPADLSLNNAGILKADPNGMGGQVHVVEADAVLALPVESSTRDQLEPLSTVMPLSTPLPAPIQSEGCSGEVHTTTDLAAAEILLFFAGTSDAPVSQPMLIDAASIPLPPSPNISPTSPVPQPPEIPPILVDAESIPLPPSPTITPTPVVTVTAPLDEPIARSEKVENGSAIKSSLNVEPQSINKLTDTNDASSPIVSLPTPASTSKSPSLPTVADGASTPPSSSKGTGQVRKQKKKQAKAAKAPSKTPVTSEKAKGKVNVVEPPSVQAEEASLSSQDLEAKLRTTLRKQKAEKEKQKKKDKVAEASASVPLSSNNIASTSSTPGASSSNPSSSSSSSKATSSKVTPPPAGASSLREEAQTKTKMMTASSAPAASSPNPQPSTSPQRSPPRGGSVSPLLRKATTTAAAQAAATFTSTSSAPAFDQVPVTLDVPAAPVFVAQQPPLASGSVQAPFAGSGSGQASSFATATQQSSNGYPTSANTGGWPMNVGSLPMGQAPSAAWNAQASPLSARSVFDVDADMQDATAPPPPLYQQVASSMVDVDMDMDMADPPPAWGWNNTQPPLFQSQPQQSIFQSQPQTQSIFQSQPQQPLFSSQPQTQSIFQSQPLFSSQPQSQSLFQSQGNAQPQAQGQASNTFFSSPPSYSTAQQQAQEPAQKPLPFQTVESVFPPPYVAPSPTRPQEQQPPVADVPPPYASQPAPLFSVFPQEQQSSPWSNFKVVVELPPIQPPRPPPKQIIIEPEYWEEFFHWLETAPEAKRFPAYPFHDDTDVPTWMMDLRDQFWALDNDLGLVWKFVCWCSRGTHFVTRLMSSKKYSEGAMLEAFIARGKDWEKYMYTRRHTPDMCGGGCKRTSR